MCVTASIIVCDKTLFTLSDKWWKNLNLIVVKHKALTLTLNVSSLCLTHFPLYSNVNANEASDVETINNRNDTNCQDIEFQAEFYWFIILYFFDSLTTLSS